MALRCRRMGGEANNAASPNPARLTIKVVCTGEIWSGVA